MRFGLKAQFFIMQISGPAGGICETYKAYQENIYGRYIQRFKTLNTGILTFVNYNSAVPAKISQLGLAHQLGHSFGSPVSIAVCV